MKYYFLIYLSLSILSVISFISCDQQSQNQKEESQSSIQQPQVSSKRAELVKKLFKGSPITAYPYSFKTLEDDDYTSWEQYGISYKLVYTFFDPTMIYENRRLFGIIDSLNDIINKTKIYEALGTIYDDLYWDDTTLEYNAIGDYYSRNELFTAWGKFNIITYIKKNNQLDNQDYSPFYMASHNKYTGDMIDRLEFDFEGTYNAIRDGRGALIVYKDSIIHQLDGNTRKYLITEEGKFEEVK
ncbi:hypothetical protein [Flammeovirga aprica]|uniref:Lipoprotein n=1 Tax=Flammeovirga aprica JL-4 TaxID=694437 RepID=A0A7X9RZA6_9BACT|nr:hypothetical protein [Flammeovirga aprica]NME71552.1 hypothetical protein [Flammeovirga aprica JL-4]